MILRMSADNQSKKKGDSSCDHQQDVPNLRRSSGGIGTHGPHGPIWQTLKEHAGGHKVSPLFFMGFPASLIHTFIYFDAQHLTPSRPVRIRRLPPARSSRAKRLLSSGSPERRARYLVCHERDPARAGRRIRRTDGAHNFIGGSADATSLTMYRCAACKAQYRRSAMRA